MTEVLIVVVIIAILAGLVLPRFAGQQTKAKVAEAVGILSSIHRALVQYADEHAGVYPNATTNESDIKKALAVDWTTANFGWNFTLNDAAGTARALQGNVSTEYIQLRANGTWCGGGSYDPTNGTKWPNLSPTACP